MIILFASVGTVRKKESMEVQEDAVHPESILVHEYGLAHLVIFFRSKSNFLSLQYLLVVRKLFYEFLLNLFSLMKCF